MRLNISIQQYDRPLLFVCLFLCAFGTIMLYSASWNESFMRSGGSTDSLFLKGHLIRMALGFCCMFVFLLIDYRSLKLIAPYLLILSLLLLISTKAYHLILGNTKPARWLSIGSFSFQTSDLARLSLIIFLAYYLDQLKLQIKNFRSGFLPCIFVIALMMTLIVIQPDFSTALIIGSIGVIILFIAGAKIKHIVFSTLIGFTMSIPVVYFKPYRLARILSFFDKSDISEGGYQAHQALLSLGNGGLFGVGLGNSVEKNHLLPTPHTDFIFSIIGEELGLFRGTLPLLIAFLYIFYRGIKISQKCTDPFGILLATGISINIVLYAFVNASVATGLFPVTGLPMPMISYGGSGLLINMAMIGILLNISQAKRSINGGLNWRNFNFG
ncbi:putative lipid II flippase FtsW [bacterium]|nr:putative lipid II flippase FtsW [bacterium]